LTIALHAIKIRRLSYTFVVCAQHMFQTKWCWGNWKDPKAALACPMFVAVPFLLSPVTIETTLHFQHRVYFFWLWSTYA
jgi:hypothetical protein